MSLSNMYFMLRKLHNVMSWVPFIWFLICISLIFVATLELGHIPQYGKDPDPTDLGFATIKLISLYVAIIGFISAFLWPLTFLVLLAIKGRKYNVSYVSLIVYSLAITLILCLKYLFPSQFLWFND